MSREKDPWFLRLLVSAITRIVYFIIGFFLVPVGSAVMFREGSISMFTYLMSPDLFDWLLCVVIGILAAIFGPYLYEVEATRGRGDLDEIRRISRGSRPGKR